MTHFEKKIKIKKTEEARKKCNLFDFLQEAISVEQFLHNKGALKKN